MPLPKPCYADCKDRIRSNFRDGAFALCAPYSAADVMISSQPPIFGTPGGFSPAAVTCPHGQTFYVWPTADQVRAWGVDG